jgi:hypothetical protein
MPAHMKRCEGNLLTGTQIQSLRMSGLLNGVPGAPAAGHLLCRFVLTLFALGGADLTGGFCLSTLSSSRPTTIVGLVLDTVVVSHAIEGTRSEESGRTKLPTCKAWG